MSYGPRVEDTTMKTLEAVSGFRHPRLSYRKPVFKVWETGELAVRSALASFRPRVSLLSGAVFVLVTLLLPIAHNSCSPNLTGAEFVRGASGKFPSVAGLTSEGFGRGFYVFALVFAAITVGVTLASLARPGALRGRRWVTGLCAVAGTVAFYLLADAVCLVLGGLICYVLDGVTNSEAVDWAAGFGLILIALAACLRSKLLRSSRVIFGLLASGVIGCSLAVELYFLHLPDRYLPEAAQVGLLYFLAALYWFIPGYLWYRFGLRGGEAQKEHWARIRAVIFKVFLPALGCVPVLFWLAWDEGVWGFVPFSIGVYLMALGYLRLAQTPAGKAALESARESAAG
jgi:hypothetical protein